MRFGSLAVLVPLLVLGACRRSGPATPPVPTVQVVQVIQRDVPIYHEWIGNLDGFVNAEIKPQVSGYVMAQMYRDGTVVRKGEVLFLIDPRNYKDAAADAQGTLSRAIAAQEKSRLDVKRDRELFAGLAITRQQLDNDLASQAAMKASVVAAQANLQNAQLNLAWTKIYSPIDGVAGNANSQIGDLVGTTTKMVTVSQVQPIWANFNISESAYLSQAAAISEFLRTGRTPKNMTVQYSQANGEEYPRPGKIVQINREVAAGTGTVQITAAFPNPDFILRPGGFGRVRIQTGYNQNALLVPQAAVIEVQSLYQVIVVSPDNKATFRPVKMGERVGPNWIVTEGLKPGERVVAEGILKIQQAAAANPQMAREGIPVSPKPYVATAAAAGSN